MSFKIFTCVKYLTLLTTNTTKYIKRIIIINLSFRKHVRARGKCIYKNNLKLTHKYSAKSYPPAHHLRLCLLSTKTNVLRWITPNKVTLHCYQIFFLHVAKMNLVNFLLGERLKMKNEIRIEIRTGGSASRSLGNYPQAYTHQTALPASSRRLRAASPTY